MTNKDQEDKLPPNFPISFLLKILIKVITI